MVSEKLIEKLNDQMNFEFLSANHYLAMAAYCASIDLDGFENFFLVQAEEERFHAMKFYNYINEVDGRASILSMEEPKNEFKFLKEAVEHALGHEKIVTDRIYKLMDLAQEEKDYATISFLQWFVDEQMEEMSLFRRLKQQLNMIGENNNGLLMLDRELAKRTFTPPADSQE